MAESVRTRAMRWGFNLFPAYRGTGGRITYIADDWREIRLRIPLTWRTRNYVGTIFGGSMYGAVDPISMIMLIRALGPGYVVWDKAASIRFRRPGRTPLHARCVLDDAELNAIRDALRDAPTVDRVYHIDLTDGEGVVHATRGKDDPRPPQGRGPIPPRLTSAFRHAKRNRGRISGGGSAPSAAPVKLIGSA